MSYKDCIIVGGVGNLIATLLLSVCKLFFITRYDETKFRVSQATSCYYCYTWSSCCSSSNCSIHLPQEDQISGKLIL